MEEGMSLWHPPLLTTEHHVADRPAGGHKFAGGGGRPSRSGGGSAPFYREEGADAPSPFYHRHRRGEGHDARAREATDAARQTYRELKERLYSATGVGSESLQWEEFKREGPSGAEALATLRAGLKQHGASGIVGLGRKFRIMDDDNSSSVDPAEFFKAVEETCPGLLSAAEAAALFKRFDVDDSGKLSYDEFLEGVREPMSAPRVELVMLAFEKLSGGRSGLLGFAGAGGGSPFVDAAALATQFRTAPHYMARSDNDEYGGQATSEQDVMDEFMATFVRPVRKQEEEEEEQQQQQRQQQEQPISSTYNANGETLYGHSTANGTAANGSVLPYDSEAPAAAPGLSLEIPGDSPATALDVSAPPTSSSSSVSLLQPDLHRRAKAAVSKDARRVTFDDFLRYYSHVSASIDRDDYFELMMRQAWGVELKHSTLMPLAGVNSALGEGGSHLDPGNAMGAVLALEEQKVGGRFGPTEEEAAESAARRLELPVTRSMPAGGVFTARAGAVVPPDPEARAAAQERSQRPPPWVPLPGQSAGAPTDDPRAAHKAPAERFFHPPPAPFVYSPRREEGGGSEASSSSSASASASASAARSTSPPPGSARAWPPQSVYESVAAPGAARDAAVEAARAARKQAAVDRQLAYQQNRDRRGGFVAGCLSVAEEARRERQRIEEARRAEGARIEAMRAAEVEQAIDDRLLAEKRAREAAQHAARERSVAEADAAVAARRAEREAAVEEEAALMESPDTACGLSSLRHFPANDALEAEVKAKAEKYASEMRGEWEGAAAKYARDKADAAAAAEAELAAMRRDVSLGEYGFIQQMHDSEQLETSRRREAERAVFAEYEREKAEKERAARLRALPHEHVAATTAGEELGGGSSSSLHPEVHELGRGHHEAFFGGHEERGLAAHASALYGMSVRDVKDLLRSPQVGKPELCEHLDAFDAANAAPIYNQWREEQPHPKRGYVAVDDARFAKMLSAWQPHLGSAELLRPAYGVVSKRQAIFLARILSLCHGQAHPWKSSLYQYHHARTGNDPHEAIRRERFNEQMRASQAANTQAAAAPAAGGGGAPKREAEAAAAAAAAVVDRRGIQGGDVRRWSGQRPRPVGHPYDPYASHLGSPHAAEAAAVEAQYSAREALAAAHRRHDEEVQAAVARALERARAENNADADADADVDAAESFAQFAGNLGEND